MTGRLAFDSQQKKTINEVFTWYKFQSEILNKEKLRVLDEINSATVSNSPRFVGMTQNEVVEFFTKHSDELNLLTGYSFIKPRGTVIPPGKAPHLIKKTSTTRVHPASRARRVSRQQFCANTVCTIGLVALLGNSCHRMYLNFSNSAQIQAMTNLGMFLVIPCNFICSKHWLNLMPQKAHRLYILLTMV